MVVCIGCKPGTDKRTIEDIWQLRTLQLKSCPIKQIVTIFDGFAVVEINVQMIVGTVPFQRTVVIRAFTVFLENKCSGEIIAIIRCIFPTYLPVANRNFWSLLLLPLRQECWREFHCRCSLADKIDWNIVEYCLMHISCSYCVLIKFRNRLKLVVWCFFWFLWVLREYSFRYYFVLELVKNISWLNCFNNKVSEKCSFKEIIYGVCCRIIWKEIQRIIYELYWLFLFFIQVVYEE